MLTFDPAPVIYRCCHDHSCYLPCNQAALSFPPTCHQLECPITCFQLRTGNTRNAQRGHPLMISKFLAFFRFSNTYMQFQKKLNFLNSRMWKQQHQMDTPFLIMRITYFIKQIGKLPFQWLVLHEGTRIRRDGVMVMEVFICMRKKMCLHYFVQYINLSQSEHNSE